MIQNDDILNMNFYKKEKFTGSYSSIAISEAFQLRRLSA